jgi:hypothetical protein
MGGGDVLSGWSLAAKAGTANAELDATAPRDGKTSIYFESRGPYATLESNSFTIPATGQFATTVFARGTATAAKAELRMVIEADQPGRPYRRAVLVGGKQPPPYDLSDQWRPYPLLVNDLPLESHGQMRIKFEMTGPGEVWLDEIKTYDLLFPLPRRIHAALAARRQASTCSPETGALTGRRATTKSGTRRWRKV